MNSPSISRRRLLFLDNRFDNLNLTGIAAGLVGLFVAIPLFYLLLRASSADPQTWLRLLQARLWTLLGNTLLLAFTVTLGTLIIGVGAAWLTERTDLTGRKFLRWLLAMPLAIPTYIGGIIHLTLMRPRGGFIPQVLSKIVGVPVSTPNPLGFWGASFILILFSVPYVYLLSGAAFRSLNASLEEASRVFGRNAIQTFWQVTLPVLRPGILAGAILVALDVLAEYGTVALLRYETFSSAIFVQLSGRYDRSSASILSGVLVLLALFLLEAEVRIQGRARFTQVDGHWRPAPTVRLGKWQPLAIVLVGALIVANLIIPLVALSLWTIQALSDPETSRMVFHTGSQGFFNYIWNSLWTSLLAGFLAVFLSLPVARLVVRHPSPFSRAVSRLAQAGYAIPGVVIALSLVLLVNRALPFLYATPFLIVIAYILRHLSQAVRATEAAISRVSVSLEEAAQTLGKSSSLAFFKVTLPLIIPGLLAGGSLVFLTSLKELPATLLLRPAGFDTLAVRIWTWAAEGFYIQAAPAALVLVLSSAGPLFFLLKKEKIFHEHA